MSSKQQYKEYIYRLKSEIKKLKSLPKQPKPPLGRVLREGYYTYLCKNCHSTMPKSGFLHLWGERLCDNEECFNSKRKYYKV